MAGAPATRAEPAPDGRTIEGVAEPVAARATLRAVPDPAGPLGQTLARMRAIDPQLDPARFLDGAEAAFRMIVGAFAGGNRDTLRALLGEETFRAFDAAITAREAAGETQRSDIRAIHEATIQEADLHGSLATIGVRFVSDQISLTLDKNGNPVTGTDAVTEITDLWTFERNLAQADPAWRLIAARSA